jgi:glutamine synthetase type III
MATVKIDPNSTSGEITFLSNPNLDLIRYFHTLDIEAINSRSQIGAQIVPVIVKTAGKIEEAYALVAVKNVDGQGNPTELHTDTGDTIALSCLPFRQQKDVFTLKVVDEITV